MIRQATGTAAWYGQGMPRYDASQAECLVFTFKEGLLSKVAHDLKIRVGRFSIDVGDSAVEAEFEAESLEVVCARENGADNPSTLGRLEKGKIQSSMRKDVLAVKKHPKIRFVSSEITKGESEATITGTLSLHGRDKSLRVKATKEGARWVAEVDLHQPDFGIKPFSAMLGTLKIQPTLKVRVEVPA